MTAFRANGAYALFRVWEIDNERGDRDAQVSKFTAATKSLGDVIDYEVLTPIVLSSRVSRYYGVTHFRKRPSWIRVDSYASDDRRGFFGVAFSETPDTVLPLKNIEAVLPN
jgi:hypothetical protein